MDAQDRTALHEFARKHHVHYEVEREETGGAPQPELVGVRLRLLATHERAKLEAPGCPPCVELLGELRSFADRVVAAAGIADRAETIPAPRKVYQSAEERNADEVALTIRVRCEAPEHRRPGGGEDRCLGELTDRLAEVGASRS